MNDNLKSTSAIMAEFDRVLSGGRARIVGTKIQVAGRTFEPVAVAPYTRSSDGAASVLVTWQSECRTCGESYTVKGSRNAMHLPVNCPEHRGRRTRHGKRPRAFHTAIGTALVALDRCDIEQARAKLEAVLGGDANKVAR